MQADVCNVRLSGLADPNGEPAVPLTSMRPVLGHNSTACEGDVVSAELIDNVIEEFLGKGYA